MSMYEMDPNIGVPYKQNGTKTEKKNDIKKFQNSILLLLFNYDFLEK